MKLIFDGVSASYRDKTVLENVSFQAEPGCITAVVGCNGAGKTTLLRCLTGDKSDYQGAILLDDRPVREMTLGERAQTIACLPQELPAPHVTVRELVSFGRTPYVHFTGRLKPADWERVEQALADAGIGENGDAFVDTLSGGERKKAFLAMIFAQDCPVVVLDEPAAHLDVRSRFELLELLSRMCRKTGKTFLVVMHDLPEILRYAHRIVVLHEHRVVFSGTPEECLAQNIPQDCFRIRISGDRENGFCAVPVK